MSGAERVIVEQSTGGGPELCVRAKGGGQTRIGTLLKETKRRLTTKTTPMTATLARQITAAEAGDQEMTGALPKRERDPGIGDDDDGVDLTSRLVKTLTVDAQQRLKQE